jgi:SAM-dependent methyltransferase
MAAYHELFSYSNNLKRDSIFVDLGSGLGKANLLVAACFPVRLSLGVEAVPRLVQISNLQKEIFKNEIERFTESYAKIEFICGMAEELVENWIFADVVFVNSLTWEKRSIRKILERLKLLKKGAEVFTSTKLSCKFLNFKRCVKTRMNWGSIPMYIYEKGDILR